LPGDPLVIGVDVAGEGSDRSIVATMRGPVVRHLRAFQKNNGTELADAVAGHLKRELMGLESDMQHAVGVDVIGIGRGVYDHLANVQRVSRCFAIDVSEKALEPTRFHRLRDQVWWELREAFMETKDICLNLTDERGNPTVDDALIGQLTSIAWAEVNGKIKVQGKGESSGIPNVPPLTESPDEADAVVMCQWLRRHYCSSMPLAAKLKRRRAQVPGSWRVV